MNEQQPAKSDNNEFNVTPDLLAPLLPDTDVAALVAAADRINTTVASAEDIALANDDDSAHTDKP